jgi:hypothetical protein
MFVLCGLDMLKLQALTAAAVTLRLVQAHPVSHTWACCSSPRPAQHELQLSTTSRVTSFDCIPTTTSLELHAHSQNTPIPFRRSCRCSHECISMPSRPDTTSTFVASFECRSKPCGKGICTNPKTLPSLRVELNMRFGLISRFSLAHMRATDEDKGSHMPFGTEP